MCVTPFFPVRLEIGNHRHARPPLIPTPGFSCGCGNVHVGACDGPVCGYLRESQTENGHSRGISPWVWHLLLKLERVWPKIVLNLKTRGYSM